ncbi:MAG TPA: alpha/beta hydrolase [Ktedonobacteraceae bacterium]
MPYFETSDHTSLYYRDWGTGTPVVFLSSWGYSGPMWEYQMVPLSERGLRCIAYDRRGHGRSDDPGRGYDFDTLADDLATFLEQLDLHEVTLISHSVAGGEIVRYLSRHGTSRIARIVLISATLPFMLQTADNPEGVPGDRIYAHVESLRTDRPHYLSTGAISFFSLGSNWPGPEVISPEMLQWSIQMLLECSPKAAIAFREVSIETDFRADLRNCSIPTLIVHGDKDTSAPLNLCGRRIAQAIAGSQLKIYEGAAHGLFLTHKDRLNSDLLDFIRS